MTPEGCRKLRAENFGLILRSLLFLLKLKEVVAAGNALPQDQVTMRIKPPASSEALEFGGSSFTKEVRQFFLDDNGIWSFPLFLLLPLTAFGGPEGYFSLAIIAFGAFGFIVS